MTDTYRQERERAMVWLSNHKVDDELKVGRHLFRVESTRGITVYVTKGKGRKLYKLETVNLEPFTVEVKEVWPGSGEIKTDVKPLARFQP